MDVITGNEMITVPPGRVALSDRRTQRTWTVGVAPFRLAAFPVTRRQWNAVTGDRPGGADGSASGADARPSGADARSSGADGELRPVAEVSWREAVAFCNALSLREGLVPAYRIRPAGAGAGADAGAGDVEWDRASDGYRLPTEAEWEHACRAGTGGPRYGPLDEIAWHRGNSGERSRPVGGRRPNPWGLHDMLGNVWEWCWDVYDAEVYGSYRVLRGGGWFDEHWSCRASVRRRSHPTLRIDDVGFRVARSAPA
ncbi:formylglycine-generating enzyme family protein [Kitasatospora sp. NPDC059571]|uniref:formylglycine-generating enzyme family protein n=1 Tax=Kitasatospora sp. NPDC059571 TaxID=3346871 RepID=UPI0036B20370